jgi:hypothetical protein
MTQHETWTVPPGMAVSDGSGSSQKPLVVVGTPATGDTVVWDGAVWAPAASSGGGGTPTVLNKAASYAVQAGDSPGVLVATAGDVVFTLPAVADGLTFTIIDTVGDFAHPTIVRPQPTERLYKPGTGGAANTGVGKGAIADWGLTAPGMEISVVGVAGVGWIVTGQAPPWTYES